MIWSNVLWYVACSAGAAHCSSASTGALAPACARRARPRSMASIPQFNPCMPGAAALAVALPGPCDYLVGAVAPEVGLAAASSGMCARMRFE